ncbi:nucleotidyltransferase family protein [Arthrobacter sp. zg-Y750]|uniref:nucleotidyltransferase family protein n=1 Tax=Arthrobacter sp. zg-Y750 TaxID=2894189 RepID=UPI001E3085F4|nr:nucleotidyltransferase family protein [Arthrobacter sp. zg-Y750]MCC9176422.1 nucleotidyltransferase family protein [Arthrobacter sp. zg-Y750]
MTGTTTAVLLAAGAGTRLGLGPKAMLPFRGRPLIEHQVRVLRDGGCATVVAVLGAGRGDILAAARLQDARPVLNPDWQRGMGTSYRSGVAAALALCPGAVLVALVDQPGLTAAVVARLLAAGRPGRITAAGYRDPGSDRLRRGHPVLFDAALAARSLEPGEAADDGDAGDTGARHFLAAHPDLVDLIDCSDLADGRDVDSEADLVLLD